jgi:hypothetical protein
MDDLIFDNEEHMRKLIKVGLAGQEVKDSWTNLKSEFSRFVGR